MLANEKWEVNPKEGFPQEYSSQAEGNQRPESPAANQKGHQGLSLCGRWPLVSLSVICVGLRLLIRTRMKTWEKKYSSHQKAGTHSEDSAGIIQG